MHAGSRSYRAMQRDHPDEGTLLFLVALSSTTSAINIRCFDCRLQRQERRLQVALCCPSHTKKKHTSLVCITDSWSAAALAKFARSDPALNSTPCVSGRQLHQPVMRCAYPRLPRKDGGHPGAVK